VHRTRLDRRGRVKSAWIGIDAGLYRTCSQPFNGEKRDRKDGAPQSCTSHRPTLPCLSVPDKAGLVVLTRDAAVNTVASGEAAKARPNQAPATPLSAAARPSLAGVWAAPGALGQRLLIAADVRDAVLPPGKRIHGDRDYRATGDWPSARSAPNAALPTNLLERVCVGRRAAVDASARRHPRYSVRASE